MRRDKVWDTFAHIVKDVRYDFEVEPKLQTLEGEPNSSITNQDVLKIKLASISKQAVSGSPDFAERFFDIKVLNLVTQPSPRYIQNAYKFHKSPKKLNKES